MKQDTYFGLGLILIWKDKVQTVQLLHDSNCAHMQFSPSVILSKLTSHIIIVNICHPGWTGVVYGKKAKCAVYGTNNKKKRII